MALMRRSWLAPVRGGLCRRLLRDFSSEEPLGPSSIAALAIADAKWRQRIIRQASSLSALRSVADSVEFIEEIVFSRPRYFHIGAALLLVVLCGPSALTTATRWLGCQASAVNCGPRMESSIPLANGKLHGAEHAQWESAILTPPVEGLGYCQSEALWGLANAKRDATTSMPLSSACASAISSALLLAKPSRSHDAKFLLSASEALSSARPIAISINDDLVSLSTWSQFKRQSLLSARDPSLPGAPLAFALSQWLWVIPSVALLGMLLIFFKNLFLWPQEFLRRNNVEVLVATEALIIELALNDGRALAPSGPTVSPRKSRRL